jgi:hypothetical protein
MNNFDKESSPQISFFKNKTLEMMIPIDKFFQMKSCWHFSFLINEALNFTFDSCVHVELGPLLQQLPKHFGRVFGFRECELRMHSKHREDHHNDFADVHAKLKLEAHTA